MSDKTLTNQELLLQATQLYNEGNMVGAGRLAQTLFADNPEDSGVLYLLGMISKRSNRLELGIKLLTMSVDLNPNHPYCHFHLADSFSQLGKEKLAETHYYKALALKPDLAHAHVNLGNLYYGRGNQKKAVSAYLAAIELDPQQDTALYNLGVISQGLGNHDAALDFFDQSLLVNPKSALTHTGRSFSLLMTGRFKEGWEAYEWRWSLPDLSPRICEQPRWDGSNPQGKRLYLYTEQGFGDALMFVRYVRLVQKQGGYVILECKPDLFRLFQSSNLADEVVFRAKEDKEMPPFPFDQHLPILNLARFYTTSEETIPKQTPYLHADPTLIEKWSERLKDLKGLKVGISWSGNPEVSVNKDRACTIHHFLPLLQIPGISFVSIQKGPPLMQLREIEEGSEILNLDPELTDFAETAAALANLDLLISTDTSVVHLAGGLDFPVWTILHTSSEWRWMLKRSDSPWYPSMKLFRQTEPGDWSIIFDQVKEELHQLAQSAESRGDPANG